MLYVPLCRVLYTGDELAVFTLTWAVSFDMVLSMNDSRTTRRTRQVITNIKEVKIAGVWVSLDLLEQILETDIYTSYINLNPGSQRDALLEAGLIEVTTGLSYCASDRLRTMVGDETGKYLADRYYKGFDDAPVIKPATDA